MAINKNFIVKNGLDVNGDATVNSNLTVEGKVTVSSNGSLIIPAGATASRPENPASGDFRFNTELGEFEGYDGSEWGSIGGAAGGSVTLEKDFVSGEEVVIAATDFTFENPSVEVTEKLSQLNQVSTKLSPDESLNNYDHLSETVANTSWNYSGSIPGLVTATLSGAPLLQRYEGGKINFYNDGILTTSALVKSIDLNGFYGFNSNGQYLSAGNINYIRYAAFGDSGNFIYYIGSSNLDVTQVALSTPYDITTATGIVNTYTATFSGAGSEPELKGLQFSDDGTKMFVSEETSEVIQSYTLATAWDISTATYDNVSFSVSGISPTNFIFDPAGTKLIWNDTYYPYLRTVDLGTAWDISTAGSTTTVDVRNIDPNVSTNTYRSGFFFFNKDGTILVYSDDGSYSGVATVLSLSTPYDITSATLESTSLIVTNIQNFYNYGVISVPGTDQYIAAGWNGLELLELIADKADLLFDEVGNIYGSSSDWEFVATETNSGKVSTIAKEHESFFLAGDSKEFPLTEISIWGFVIANNGTKMYTRSNDYVYEFELTTPNDISTAKFNHKIDVDSRPTGTYGIDISHDGTVIFTGKDSSRGEFITIDLSTPFDLSSGSVDTSIYPFANGGNGWNLLDFKFADSGNKLYAVFEDNTNTVVEYDLTGDPYGKSSYNASNTFSVPRTSNGVYGIEVAQDGSSIFLLAKESIIQYDLLTPYDLSTATIKSVDKTNSYGIRLLNTRDNSYNYYGLTFNSDHTALFTKDDFLNSDQAFSSEAIEYYDKINLHSADKLSSFEVLDSVNGISNLYSLTFKDDGTRLYTGNGGTVYQHDLSVAWDISTANTSFSGSSSVSGYVYFNDDGASYYEITNNNQAYFVKYNLATAWDVTSATSTGINGQLYEDSSVGDKEFIIGKPDGSNLFIASENGIDEFFLPTPFDISTAYKTKNHANSDLYLKNDTKCAFTSDGLNLYGYQDDNEGILFRVQLEKAWNPSSVIHEEIIPLHMLALDNNGPTNSVNGIYVKDSENKLFLTSGQAIFAMDITNRSISGVTVNEKVYENVSTESENTILSVNNSDIYTSGSNKVKKYTTQNGNIETLKFDQSAYIGVNSNAKIVDDENKLIYLNDNTKTFRSTDLKESSILNSLENVSEKTFYYLSGSSTLSENGYHLYTIESNSTLVRHYELDVPFDLQTAKHKSFLNLPFVTSYDDIKISEDGYYLMIGVNDNNSYELYVYNLEKPFALKSSNLRLEPDQKTYLLETPSSFNSRVLFDRSGYKMYAYNGYRLYQYNLETPRTPDNIDKPDSAIQLSDSITNSFISSFNFSQDGQYLFVADGNSTLYRWELNEKWNIETIDKTTEISLASLGGVAVSISLSETGDKLIIALSDGRHKQYDMTNYDISNATNVSNVDFPNNTWHTYIKPDGTKLFTNDSGTVKEYDIPTAWDLSGVSTTPVNTYSVGFSLSSIYLNDDGDELYTYNEGELSKFTLNSNWSLSSVTDNDVQYRISVIFSARAVLVSTDGKYMLVADATTNSNFDTSGNNIIRFYVMSTPFDFSTAEEYYAFDYTNILPNETLLLNSTSLAYNEDGSILNAVLFNRSGSKTYHIKFSLNRPYDLSSYEQINFFERTQDSYDTDASNIREISFVDRGKKLFIDLADVKTIKSAVSDYSVLDVMNEKESPKFFNGFGGTSDYDSNPRGFTIGNGGNTLYVANGNDSNVYATTLNTPNDLTSIDLDTAVEYKSETNEDVTSIKFKPDGSKVYMTSRFANLVYEFNLPTPWDFSTKTLENTLDISSVSGDPSDIEWKPDGTRFWITDVIDGRVYEYDLNTAWDISTASYTFNSISNYRSTSIRWNDDGTKYFIMIRGGYQVTIYEPTIAYDITASASITYRYNITEFGAGFDFLFYDSGSKVAALLNNSILSYNLVAPYDYAGTTSLDNSNDNDFDDEIVTLKGLTSIRDFDITNNGTKIVATGISTNHVQEYILSTPFDISTLSIADSYIFDNFSNVSGITLDENNGKVYLSTSGSTYTFYTDWPFDSSNIHIQTYNKNLSVLSANYIDYENKSIYVKSNNDFASQISLTQPFVTTSDGIALTNTKGYELSEYWTNIENVTATTQNATANNLNVLISSNDRTLFSGFTDSGGARNVVRNESGQWQYNVGGSTLTNYVLESANNVNDPYTFNPPGIIFPERFTFGDNGNRIYIMGGNGGYDEKIISASLSTPYDISSLTYNNEEYDHDTDLSSYGYDDLRFKPDGTEMFIASGSERIYKIDLSSAWDISTASYSSVSLDVSSEIIDIGAFAFGDSGNKLFILDAELDEIYEYSMSVSYDITTASYSNTSINVSNEAPSARHIDFDSSGKYLYVSCVTNDQIVEYELATSWDLSSGITLIGVHDISSQTSSPNMIRVNPDGSELYLFSTVEDRIEKYDMSVNNDITTMSYSGISKIIVNGGNDPEHMQLKDDGTVMYVSHDGKKYISVYNLSTPDDISTASFVEDIDFSASITSTEQISSFFIGDNGTKLYISETFDSYADPSTSFVKQYDLGTAWDLSTATLVGTKDFTGVEEVTINRNQIQIKPDGTKLFVHGVRDEIVYEFDLTTPWDITTATYNNNSFNIFGALNSAGISENSSWRIYINDEGTRWFMFGYGRDEIFQFSMATPWNISSSSYDGVLLNVDDITTYSVRAFTFNNDGSKLYIGEYQNGQIHEFNTRGLDPLSVIWTDASSNNLKQAILDSQTVDLNLTSIEDLNTHGNSIIPKENLGLAFIFSNELTSNSTIDEAVSVSNIQITYDAQDMHQPVELHQNQYEYSVPSNSKIYFKSLENKTFKITVK